MIYLVLLVVYINQDLDILVNLEQEPKAPELMQMGMLLISLQSCCTWHGTQLRIQLHVLLQIAYTCTMPEEER